MTDRDGFDQWIEAVRAKVATELDISPEEAEKRCWFHAPHWRDLYDDGASIAEAAIVALSDYD